MDFLFELLKWWLYQIVRILEDQDEFIRALFKLNELSQW